MPLVSGCLAFLLVLTRASFTSAFDTLSASYELLLRLSASLFSASSIYTTLVFQVRPGLLLPSSTIQVLPSSISRIRGGYCTNQRGDFCVCICKAKGTACIQRVFRSRIPSSDQLICAIQHLVSQPPLARLKIHTFRLLRSPLHSPEFPYNPTRLAHAPRVQRTAQKQQVP